MMKQAIPVVTIDGPSGVGKGTLSLSLANAFGWHLLDSGAIYRVLALSAIKHNVALDDELSLERLALSLPLVFVTETTGVNILLDNENVSTTIRNETVGTAASKVAVLPSVRNALLQRQRDFQLTPGLIADGRDMGTIVFPNAPAKIFLDASPAARAIRRMKQLQEQGKCAKFDKIFSDIVERDERDRNRSVAPLNAAADALVIDSTSLTLAEVFDSAVKHIKNKIVF